MNESKIIVASAGRCWHRNFELVPYGVSLSGTRKIDKCRCGSTDFTNPDLSLPENLHLLHECVNEILDTDSRVAEYGSYFWNIIGSGSQMHYFVEIAAYTLVTPEQIIRAILPIAEAKLGMVGSEDVSELKERE